jgi:hypothetical protein
MQTKKQIQEIEIRKLNPHEQIIEENLKKLLTSLKVERRLKEPIIVDEETNVVLDGHHRAKAFSLLGLKEIPCRLVDYSSEDITVEPHQNGDVTKEDVIKKGLSEELFPPKTSKHRINPDINKS